MSILSTIRGWIAMLFDAKAKEEFGVKPIPKTQTNAFIEECQNIYAGMPAWATGDISTINFAKAICSEVARLVMQGTKITVDGSQRAEMLQEEIDDNYKDIRRWVEYGCANGIIIMKPNGESIDIAKPGEFIITKTDGSKVKGCVFCNTQYSDERYYTRLEYHRFEDEKYLISNRCFVSNSKDSIGKPIDIDATPWVGMAEDVESDNIDRMLFGVFKMPGANNIDPDSPYTLPIFADAVQELEDLDVSYSRNAKEVFDSKRTVLLDSDRLIPSGTKLGTDYDGAREKAGLPDIVKIVQGVGDGAMYQEINPTLQTDTRLVGLNALLSQIGYKCGFSNGYFVFNQRTGMVTATQVESDDRRTLQLIKDVRDQLQACMDDLIYALDKFLDNEGAPVGKYEVTYDFGDLTYNREEDRQRWWSYVIAGAVPKWVYFQKFEGMSEEDAKKMVDEATPKEGLFPEQEE